MGQSKTAPTKINTKMTSLSRSLVLIRRKFFTMFWFVLIRLVWFETVYGYERRGGGGGRRGKGTVEGGKQKREENRGGRGKGLRKVLQIKPICDKKEEGNILPSSDYVAYSKNTVVVIKLMNSNGTEKLQPCSCWKTLKCYISTRGGGKAVRYDTRWAKTVSIFRDDLRNSKGRGRRKKKEETGNRR